MVYRPPYPWYFDLPNHDISTPLTMVYRHATHGILTPLPMVYRPLNPWYFDPPAHGISTPLPMVYQTLLWYYEILSVGRNEGGGVQFTMRGFKIQ